MSWICIRCSERHLDGADSMGFGLCKACREKVRLKNAEERAAMIAARKKRKAAGTRPKASRK